MAERVNACLAQRLSRRASELEPIGARVRMELSAALRAEGKHVLSIYGAPHWLPPEHVLEAAGRAVRDNTGMPAEGLVPLRHAVAERIAEEKGIKVDAESQVLVTNGANHGLYVAFMATVNPGDEVLMFSPHYYYQGIVHLAGGRTIYAPVNEHDRWAWDVDALREAVTPRTRVIVVNTPTNPTGYVAREADLNAIAELAAEHGLYVISDEAYDHTVYDGRRHVSFGSLPGVGELTLSVLSCTKSYAMRHWRLGFLIAPADLMPKLRDILEWNCFMVNNIAQHAALAAVRGPQQWIAEISRRFERNRELVCERLQVVPGLSFARPEGGPFIFLNVSGRAKSPRDFHRRLLVDYGVPTDPGEAFGSDQHVRVPFGGEPEDVREAGARIARAASAAGMR